MAYEDTPRTQTQPHSIKIDNRSSMCITGVIDVAGFDEATVILTTSKGELTLHGDGLHVDRIDLDAGEVDVRGSLSELSYGEAHDNGGLWARLFG